MRTSTSRSRTLLATLALVASIGLTGCGGDGGGATAGDDTDADQAFCDAAGALQSDIQDLRNVDVVKEGTEALKTSAEDVRQDLAKLRETGSDVAADELDALSKAVDELDQSLESVGAGDLSAAARAQLVASAKAIRPTVDSVVTSLQEACP